MLIRNGMGQQREDENSICLKHTGNVLIPNPIDCHSFYACQHGYAMKIICPNDSIFNPKLGNCDPEYDVCVIDENGMAEIKELLSEDINHAGEYDTTDLSTSTTTTPTTSTSTTNPIETSTTTTTIIPTTTTEQNPDDCETCTDSTLSNLCPSEDSEDPTFVESDSFCDSFYLCYHGRPYEMFCPNGFYWSQEEEKCIPQWKSNCTDSTGIKAPKCPSKGQFFIPHSDRCNLFYYCENGIRSIQQCTAFQQWDVVEQTCKLDVRAKCIKAIPRSQRGKYFLL